MEFRFEKKLHTGVAIPVGALTGADSCGCGEFADLPQLGGWCKDTGLDIIQILPINDTGTNPSPYSAVSATALNPVYARLKEIPGAHFFADQIDAFAELHRGYDHVRYAEVYEFKTAQFRIIFEKNTSSIMNDQGLSSWIAENDWVMPYAAFKILARQNQTVVWSAWRTDSVFHSDEKTRWELLKQFWIDNPRECRFYAWVQFELERQLLEASRALEQNGIMLKGDLPILMDRESCDVWFYRQYFSPDYTAGAPPDQFAEDGQNWGFPVFDRQALENDDFLWWKRRIARVDKFFHAIRLDHVVGFMRIWQVPVSETHAALGFFCPAVDLTREDLIKAQFTEEEIEAMATPLVDNAFLQNCASEAALEYLQKTCLQSFGDFHTLTGKLSSENAILALNEPGEIKKILHKIHKNRILVALGATNEPQFAPTWSYKDSVYYRRMTDSAKAALDLTIGIRQRSCEDLWFDEGRHFLSKFLSSSNALFCGEDLGVVPERAPEMLKDLHIMSLKVLRWTRKYDQESAPFILPGDYPALSVATTSVHDSDNIRQWWKHDPDARNRLYPLFKAPGLPGPGENNINGGEVPGELDPETAFDLLAWFFKTSSEIVIIPIQDFFAVDTNYALADPARERINIPGQVLDTNWTYKMPCDLEALAANKNFIEKIRRLSALRDG